MRARWPGLGAYLVLVRTAPLALGITLVAAGLGGGQTPLSGTPNPIPDQVTSVDAGSRLYQANCAACHGIDGSGSGPLADTTPVRAPSLKAHLGGHTDGDLFFWISNGLPGGMPAWAGKLSETDRWNLVNYLRSINGQSPSAPTTAPQPAAIGPGVLVLILPVAWAGFWSVWLARGIRIGQRRGSGHRAELTATVTATARHEYAPTLAGEPASAAVGAAADDRQVTEVHFEAPAGPK